jgi:hypothetical protein
MRAGLEFCFIRFGTKQHHEVVVELCKTGPKVLLSLKVLALVSNVLWSDFVEIRIDKTRV